MKVYKDFSNWYGDSEKGMFWVNKYDCLNKTNETVTVSSSSTSITQVVGATYQIVVNTPIGMLNSDYGKPDYDYRVLDGAARRIKLPDGTIIEVAADGSYVINDAGAQVVYRANRVHEFNRYVNASDLLEEFIQYCGSLGVRQSEMMKLPVELFIAWLITEAAKADDEVLDGTESPARSIKRIAKARCLACGRFIRVAARRRKQIEMCNSRCFERYTEKIAA